MSKPLTVTLEQLTEKTDGCWLWKGCGSTGARGRTSCIGYGIIRRGKRQFFAHRVAWEQRFGPIPDGMVVCHKCDNPPCVNPDHLFVGTMADNSRDRESKGRTKIPRLRGEQAGGAKLTNTDVIQIRSLRGTMSQKKIAARFGISAAHVSEIQTGNKWAHLPGAATDRKKFNQPTCANGHEFTTENTYIVRNSGHRVCRACHREQVRLKKRIKQGWPRELALTLPALENGKRLSDELLAKRNEVKQP